MVLTRYDVPISYQQTGGIENPLQGPYRIVVNGIVVASLTVGELPDGCCEQGLGPSCMEQYFDLAGLRVNVSGCPFEELNGIYVMPQYPTQAWPDQRWWSDRYIDSGTTTMTNLSECLTWRTYEVKYTYAFSCPGNPRILQLPSDVYLSLGLRVSVGRQVYRCAQDVDVSYIVRVVNYVPAQNASCSSGWVYELLENVDAGCNDPASDVISVNLQESEFLGEYTSAHFQQCSSWSRNCCGGGIF
jgi:hypothetical protein